MRIRVITITNHKYDISFDGVLVDFQTYLHNKTWITAECGTFIRASSIISFLEPVDLNALVHKWAP